MSFPLGFKVEDYKALATHIFNDPYSGRVS